jgi:hypothetical protein
MVTETRRTALLIVLGILLLAGVWRSLQPLLWEPTVPTAVPPRKNAKHSPRTEDRLAALHIADLDRIPHGLTGGRDPWRFMDPLPPPSVIEPVPTSPLRLPPTDPQPPSPAVVTAPAPPELGVEYLGNFGPPQRKIAVFSNGKEIYNAREGDVIDGKFIVARIGYESVDVRFVDFPDAPFRRVGVRQR